MITLIFGSIMIIGTGFAITGFICHIIDTKAESELKHICGQNNDCEFCPKYYHCYLRR